MPPLMNVNLSNAAMRAAGLQIFLKPPKAFAYEQKRNQRRQWLFMKIFTGLIR